MQIYPDKLDQDSDNVFKNSTFNDSKLKNKKSKFLTQI
jgi:hypothetical protein